MKSITTNFTVEIFDEKPLRGYFEHNELGDNCAGELLFEGKGLIDYDELAAVAHALNTRPRKTLGWKTPAEAINEQLVLLTQPGVASTG